MASRALGDLATKSDVSSSTLMTVLRAITIMMMIRGTITNHIITVLTIIYLITWSNPGHHMTSIRWFWRR